MATKEQKFTALNEAIKISKEFARGGSEKVTPGFVIEEVYNLLVKLTDDIEAEQKKN